MSVADLRRAGNIAGQSDQAPEHALPEGNGPRLRVLFLVEGNTDIRFVSGLSEVFDLTLAVPKHPYEQSGLKERVAQAGLDLRVYELLGGRLAFQFRSLSYLWKHI